MTTHRFVSLTTRIAVIASLALVLMLLLLVVVIPRVMGWVPLTIVSGSMDPEISVGSQVVVEPVGPGLADGDDPQAIDARAAEMSDDIVVVGDVITFMPLPDNDALVTHRVVGVGSDAAGDLIWTTRGDANESDAVEQVTTTQIRGLVRYDVPYIGYLATWLNPQQKDVGTIIAAVALLGYAAWQVIAMLRERRSGAPRAAVGGVAPSAYHEE